MRICLIAVVIVVVVASRAYGEAPMSPRLAALAAKVAAGDRGAEHAFWNQVAGEGTPLVEDTSDPRGRLLVTFVYRAKPDTRAVAIYDAPGGINGGYARLDRLAGTGVFAYSALVDPAARFTYFLAPGDDFGPPGGLDDYRKRQPLFRPDPLNKHPFHMASLVELPKAPPQPLLVPHRGTPTGELAERTVKSKLLGNERRVAVYTPPGWQAKGAAYPLVVMFDGPTAIVALALPIVLDELIAAKKIPPVVVLLIGNADRSKELPGNPVFADFVALDLVPWVRRAYHATDDPRLTVIAGISYGGIAAAFAAARHPAVYGNVLSQSGSYWWGPDDTDEGEAHPHDYATRPKLPLRFWMEAGTLESGAQKRGYDQLVANRHMRDVLVARGYDVTYREFAGEHAYVSWRGTIGDGLIALVGKPPSFAGKPPASPGKPGGIELGEVRTPLLPKVQRMAILDGGDATVAWLEKQDAPLVTEDAVGNAAYALLELDHTKEALAIFEWNARRFPNSANVHDSLGEAYWHAGDRPRAIASYQRSLELDPKNANAKVMLDLLR